jgi:branched-subunit amino acid transport protein AzlD
MGKKSDLSPECQSLYKSCLPFLVRKRQRRSQLSHLIGYIKGHLKLWVCLTQKRQATFLQTFGIPETFYPFYKKNEKYNNNS